MVGRSLRWSGRALLLAVVLAALGGCGGGIAATPEPTPTPGARFLMPTPMAPVSEVPRTAAPEMLKYIVQEGDTLYDISLRYKVDMDELIRINKLTDPNSLRIGQELWIPVAPRETVPPTP